MKKLLLAALLLFSSPALAQNVFFPANPGDMIVKGTVGAWTGVPGGTAGCALISNGPTAAPTWQCALPLNFGLPPMATNRFLGNASGVQAPPSALTINQVLDTVGYDTLRTPTNGSLIVKEPATGTWQALVPSPNVGWVLTSAGSLQTPIWAFLAGSASPGAVGTCLVSNGPTISPSYQSCLAAYVPSAGNILVGSGTDWFSRTMSGACTINASGVTSCSAGALTGILPVGNGGTGTSTVFTQGSVVFAGPSGVYAQDNANLFWDSATHALGLGTTTLQANARLTVAGNAHVTTANPMFALPNYTFDISAPTGHAGFAIDSVTVAPDGNALMVQSISSGAGISSGGAGYFGVVNNSTGGGWDGYGTFHVLNTPNAQSTPAGVALWGTLRGERALGGTALDGTRSTNEMSYDAVVTFNTTTEAVVWPNHALQVNDEVAFTATGVLATPLVVDTKYFVKTVLDVNNFTLSATAGGALILLSGAPTPTTTAHVYQNPARGLIVFNSTKYNAFNWGLQIPSAVQYGVQVGDPVFSTTHIIPTHPFSFFNGDATPKELFFVNNNGTVNLAAAANVNTRFLTMKASSDADTAIMAIAMQNASGTDKMLQWTDVTTGTYRFKSAGPMSLHTNDVNISAAGAAITLNTSQNVQFNAYTAGLIKSDGSGNLTSMSGLGNVTLDGSNVPTSTRGQLYGVNSNTAATAGNIGELVTSTVAQGSPVSLATGTAKTMTSISLTAGEWDVTGVMGMSGAATTTITNAYCFISQTNNTTDGTIGNWTTIVYSSAGTTVLNTADVVFACPTVRKSLSATTTIYSVALSTFGVSTMGAYGFLRATRVH